MKYGVFALLLALAAVVIAACRQEQAGGQPQQTQVSRGPQGRRNPQVCQEFQAGEDSHPGGEAASGDESRTSDDPGAGPGAGAGEQPLLLEDDAPLLLEDDPPLLLDGDGDESSPAAGPVADNSRCHHCHLNYVDEDLAVVHADANIGCADCHGNCDEHIADESWASGGNGTPPEIMYPREKINPFCLDCHPKDEIDDLEHKRFLAGTAGEKYCTVCHGDHRLGERKCKWK